MPGSTSKYEQPSLEPPVAVAKRLRLKSYCSGRSDAKAHATMTWAHSTHVDARKNERRQRVSRAGKQKSASSFGALFTGKEGFRQLSRRRGSHFTQVLDACGALRARLRKTTSFAQVECARIHFERSGPKRIDFHIHAANKTQKSNSPCTAMANQDCKKSNRSKSRSREPSRPRGS